MKTTFRLLSCVLAVLTALTVTGLLASCSLKAGEKEPPLTDPVPADHVWKAEYIPFPETISSGLQFSASGGAVTFVGVRVLSEDPYKTERFLVTFDLTEKTFASEPFSEDVRGTVLDYRKKPDGGSVLLTETYDKTTDAQTVVLTSAAPDGSTLFSLDANAQFLQVQNETPFPFSVNAVQMDRDGNLYLMANQNAVVLSPAGQRLYEVIFPAFIEQSGVTPGGDVYVSCPEWIGEQSMPVFRLFDNENRKIGEELPLPACLPSANAKMHMAPGFDIYYTNPSGLYGVDREDTEPTMLCSWINSDFTPEQVGQVMVLSERQMLFQTRDPVSSAAQFCLLTPAAPEDVVPKYLIHVAVSQHFSREFSKFAVAFNRENDRYRVVLDFYQGILNPELQKSPMDFLKEDLVRGKIPDVIISDNSGYALSFDELEKLGILRDLYPFLDRSDDAAFTREAFFPCVLRPFETPEGELHGLISSFGLETLAAKAEGADDPVLWKPSDMLALAESLSEGQNLLTYWPLPADDPRTPPLEMRMLNTLLPAALSSFVDEENAVCTFDDPEFAALLELCALCPAMEWDAQFSEAQALQKGDLLLQQVGLVEFTSYLQTRDYLFRDFDFRYIGFPTADETHVCGTAVVPMQVYSITKESPVAEGAWEFIRRCFGTDEEFYVYNDGFRSLRTAFDKQFEKGLLMVTTFQERGSGGNSVLSYEDLPAAIERAEQKKQPGQVVSVLRPDDKAFFLSLFETVTLKKMYNPFLESIIKEEASAYFAGAKTLAETVRIIQSRASIYMSESAA